MKRILLISRSSWSNSNSIGNTFSSIFKGWDENCISNIYCRSNFPENEICKKYFSISDGRLLKSIYKKGFSAGMPIERSNDSNVLIRKEQKREKKLYDFFKVNRLIIFLWFQELLWYFGRWKNKKLDDFLIENDPEIIFFPVFQSIYAHRLLWYVKKKTNAKIILFHADDFVTMKQFSLSPLFWINRIICKKVISKSVRMADLNYCITEKQSNEYDKIFKIQSSILYKFDDFKEEFSESSINSPIKLVYTGNVNLGRWKTLSEIGKTLKRINAKEITATLDVYTLSPLTKEMEKELNDNESIFLRGSLSSNEVEKVQKEADVLIHVESFSLKEKLQVRLSFSTKIVDYFNRGKCIFAVGWKEAASIDYLIKNDAAVVAIDKSEIDIKLKELISNPKMILEYGEKAWNCGVRNHQIHDIQSKLFEDLARIAGK